jgi:hypothetical protein
MEDDTGLKKFFARSSSKVASSPGGTVVLANFQTATQPIAPN